jgi:hypothetical protein
LCTLFERTKKKEKENEKFCLLEMHARAFYMLTSLRNDHLNHHHLYKFLIIFYWWLCPYVAVSYVGNSMSFCLFFSSSTTMWKKEILFEK